MSLTQISQPALIASSNSSKQGDRSQIFNFQRARNLARQAAERANGGLSQYRTEPAMHSPDVNVPYVENQDGSLTFTIRGGAPGAEVFSIESIVTVDPANWRVTVDYNGAIR